MIETDEVRKEIDGLVWDYIERPNAKRPPPPAHAAGIVAGRMTERIEAQDWGEGARYASAGALIAADSRQAELSYGFLMALGVCMLRSGLPRDAKRNFKLALRGFVSLGSRDEVGGALLDLACVEAELGDCVNAAAYSRLGSEMLAEFGDPEAGTAASSAEVFNGALDTRHALKAEEKYQKLKAKYGGISA